MTTKPYSHAHSRTWSKLKTSYLKLFLIASSCNGLLDYVYLSIVISNGTEKSKFYIWYNLFESLCISKNFHYRKISIVADPYNSPIFRYQSPVHVRSILFAWVKWCCHGDQYYSLSGPSLSSPSLLQRTTISSLCLHPLTLFQYIPI